MSKIDILDFQNPNIERVDSIASKFLKENRDLFYPMMNEYGYNPQNSPTYKDRALREVRNGEYAVDNLKVFTKSIFSKKSYEDLLKEYKQKADYTNPVNRKAEGSFIGHYAIPALVTEVVTIEENIYSEMLRDTYGESKEKSFLLRKLPFMEEEKQSSIELLENAKNNGIDVSSTLDVLKANAINNDEEILLEALERQRIEKLTKTILINLNKDYKEAIQNGTDTLQTSSVKNIKIILNNIDKVKDNHFQNFSEMSRDEIIKENASELESLKLILEQNVFTSGNSNEHIYNQMFDYTYSKNKIYQGNYSKKDIENYLEGQYKIYETIYNSKDKDMESLDALNFRNNLELAVEFVETASEQRLMEFSFKKASAFISWNEKAMEALENRTDIDLNNIKRNLQRTSYSVNDDIVDSFDRTINPISEREKLEQIEFDRNKKDYEQNLGKVAYVLE